MLLPVSPPGNLMSVKKQMQNELRKYLANMTSNGNYSQSPYYYPKG